MKKLLLLVALVFSINATQAQRGYTGDKTYASRFGSVYTQNSNSDITVTNSTGQDIILVWKTAYGKYINHAYIRTNQKYTFTKLPVGNMKYFFKSSTSFYKDDDYVSVERNYGYTLKLFMSSGYSLN